ncbi:MAG: glycosyl hydrolase [Desulfitobacteriaceae bacterium]
MENFSSYANTLDKNLFKTPPKEYSPVAFWFWNGDIKEEEIVRQIDEMVDKGVYGGFMHARRALTTPYLTEEWWKVITGAVEHSSKVGFYPWIYDEYAWPSGAAGSVDKNSNQTYSKVLAEGDKNNAKGLDYIIKDTHKGEKFNLCNINIEIGQKVVAVIAVKSISEKDIDESFFIDITDKEEWEVTEENCKIFVFCQYILSHRIDYLNYDTIKSFIKYTYEEYKKRYSKYFGNVIPGSFFDEIHNDGRPVVWTELFLDKFIEYKDYNLKNYLPVLIVDAGRITDKIRCDYFDVLARLYEEAFFKQLGKWCEENNLKLTGHTEEWVQHQSLAQGDYFRTIKHLQVPGTDNHCYRYRHPRTIFPMEAKVLSSICHITGKERAMSEVMGGAGWAASLDELKMGTDMLYAFGVNMLVPHGFHYTYDTPDGMDDWPPSWFYQNPYWKYFKKFADYISRLSYMNAGGRHHCKVALLYPITSMWANTRDNKILTSNSLWGTPTHVNNNEVIKPLADYYNDIISEMVENHIDLDIIDEDSLKQTEILNDKITISNEEYSVLILPPITTISRDTVKKIKEFYNKGGKLVSINMLPRASSEEGREDEYVMDVFKDIFYPDYAKGYTVKENEFNGKAYFVSNDIKLIPKVVEECIERDFTVIDEDKKDLYYIHKEKDNRHFYFVVNTRQEKRKVNMLFNIFGKPSIWDPEDGIIKKISSYSVNEKGISMESDFEPRQAFYIVFDQSEAGSINSINSEKPDMDVKREIVDISEGWDYIVAPKELNNVWKCTLDESHVEIPVAEFSWTKGSIQAQENGTLKNEWELIKIKDSICSDEGCGRYVSSWDGKWIAYRPNWRDEAEKTMYSRKELILKNISQITHAWFCLTAVSSYKLYINSIPVGEGSDWKTPGMYDIKKYLYEGKNVIAVHIKRAENVFDDVSGRTVAPESLMSLLGEGIINYSDGKEVKLATDSSWVCNIVEVHGWQDINFQYKYAIADIAENMWGISDVPYGPLDTETWLNAWERGKPPLKPFGNLPLAGKDIEFPITLVYRFNLPIGTSGVYVPNIRGKYNIFINGEEIKENQFVCDCYAIGKDASENKELIIKVTAQSFEDGLMEPVNIQCVPSVTQQLTPWSQFSLNWYSGRGLYSKEIEVGESLFENQIKLNLGKVNFFAEIWVNENLVDTRLWEPYEADITKYLVKGKNRIVIVVANLLANQMKWDIYDQVKGKVVNSYWHNENIDRDSQNLISGLLGPVKLIVG